MVDYLRGGAYQSFAGRGAGDVPQLAVLFRDDVDTRDRPQRSSHLLPKFALQRIFPLEASREVGQADDPDAHPRSAPRARLPVSLAAPISRSSSSALATAACAPPRSTSTPSPMPTKDAEPSICCVTYGVAELRSVKDQGGSAALRRDGAARAALWLEAPLARARLPSCLPHDQLRAIECQCSASWSTSSLPDSPSRDRRVKGALRASLRDRRTADPGPGDRSQGLGSYEEGRARIADG
jgi:hypothetical protein